MVTLVLGDGGGGRGKGGDGREEEEDKEECGNRVEGKLSRK